MKKSTKKWPKKVAKIKLTANDLAFIDYVKAECKRTGIKCDLRPTTYIRCDSIKCSGYFDSESKLLVVSMNRPDFLSILVHEYCHLTQWQDEHPLWDKTALSLGKIDEWLTGKRVHNISKHLANARDLELDNERRSVQMMKKWKLSIDTKDYTRKANAYVHFYNWLYYTRRWSEPKNSPYTNGVIVAAMSSKFNMKYSSMPDKVLNAFISESI
jgi:hypothetical protein